jgi:two-component system sensor histidine kinase DegS
MLARLELAVQGLEETWRFLERGQGHLTGDESGRDAGAGPAPGDGASMRILEAQEGERARLAAELHDGPAQALANAVFQVEIVDRSLVTDREAARREVRALRALLERELDDVRGYINQLRPALDEPRALDAALRDAADDLRATTAASVEVRLDGGADGLDPVARSVVLRVAQEALRNVRKHADARHVWLTTALRPGSDGARWVLEVRDDGRGFDTQEASTRTNRRHFGLRFMRERAALIGAGLDVEASVATGTTVRLTIERG